MNAVSIASNLARRVVRRLPPPWQTGLLSWRSRLLAPEPNGRCSPSNAALAELHRNALDDREPLGDLLEFSAGPGTSLGCVSPLLRELGLDGVRLFRFESFQGPAAEAALERSRATLQQHGVDLARLTLSRGWFSDMLTPAFRAKHALDKASLIRIDGDLPRVAAVLRFVEPLIQERVVLSFDAGSAGALADCALAFAEFLALHPAFTVAELDAHCFLVTRSRDVTRAR